MRMNRGALGDEGVSVVKSFFNRLGYVKAYLNSDDTQPVWDGNLFIYNHRSEFTNERLKFIVPVQIKTHEFESEKFPKSTFYDIELVNLINYENDGGVVFFNVLVGPESSRIYVNFLTKSSIQKYLDSAKGSKTRRVEFTIIPKNYTEIIRHLRTLYLQRTHTLIPFEQAKKYTNVQWAIDSYGLNLENNPLEYITSNPVNILAIVEGIKTPFYVGDSAAYISSISLPKNCNIRIGDTIFFNCITTVVEGTTNTVNIGKSLTLKFVKYNEITNVTVSVELHGNSIEELIYEINFIITLFEKKQILFDDFKLDLPINVDLSLVNDWKSKLQFWNDVKDLFILLHIEEPINNIQQLSDEDIYRIKTLIAGLLYGKTVIGKNGMKEDHLEWISFSNIRVLVFARYLSDNKYKLINIFNTLSAYYKDLDGEIKPANIYSKIIAEDILASNVDWSNLLKSYQETIDINPDFYERANWDVLWLIKLYDKYKRHSIIAAAEELLVWIMKTDKSSNWHNVWRYNLIQIKLRMRSCLESCDREWLLDQEELIQSNNDFNDTQKKQTLFAIQVLLSNVFKAKRFFDRMTSDEKKFISGLPIYNLYKKLINIDNG